MAEGVILTIVFNYFRDFPLHGVIFDHIGVEFFVEFTLIIFCADALGIMVSCIVKTENTAMTVMPFVLIIQLVMAGVMFELPESAEIIKEFTISKWGLTVVCRSSDLNEIPTKDTLEKFKEAAESDESIHSWKDLNLTQTYEMEYDSSIQHVIQSWLVLIWYSAIYGIVGILFLKLVDRDKR